MFNALLDDPGELAAAMADGTVAATGDVAVLRRLLQAVTNSASTSS